MKISIIIPVYNTSPYLRECLDSIFSQDYHDCEVLCVDDGSTDDSLDILNEYQQHYPNNMIVLSQSNQGQSVARNTAMDKATGDYVVFLDSDDYFMPNALQDICSLVNTYPQCDVIYTDCAMDSSLGKRFYTLPCTTESKSLIEMYDYLWEHFNYPPAGCVWGGIYKRSFLNDNRLRMLPKVQYEDELFIATIYTKSGLGVAVHVERPFYWYRTNREGSTTSILALHFMDQQRISREIFKVISDADLRTNARKRLVFNLYLNYLCQAYINHFRLKSCKFFKRLDLYIMRQCVLEDRDKKLVQLTAVHPMLMAAYKTDSLPPLLRRFINRFM